jgi:hypothetical protein
MKFLARRNFIVHMYTCLCFVTAFISSRAGSSRKDAAQRIPCRKGPCGRRHDALWPHTKARPPKNAQVMSDFKIPVTLAVR